jgi:hypothetical protein
MRRCQLLLATAFRKTASYAVGFSVDIVLLPMQRGVGLDDDALLGPLLQRFYQLNLKFRFSKAIHSTEKSATREMNLPAASSRTCR